MNITFILLFFFFAFTLLTLSSIHKLNHILLYKKEPYWLSIDQHHPGNPRRRTLHPPTASPMQVIIWFFCNSQTQRTARTVHKLSDNSSDSGWDISTVFRHRA